MAAASQPIGDSQIAATQVLETLPMTADETPTGDDLLPPAVVTWGRLLAETPSYDMIELMGDEVIIGRHHTCHVRLHDLNISNRHAKFYLGQLEGPAEQLVFVKDLNSSNGLYINKERLPKGGEMVLKDNDEVAFTPKMTPKYIFKDDSASSGQLESLTPEFRDKYNLNLLPLGSDAFAIVHKVVERRTGKTFAIKRILKGKMRGSQILPAESSMGAAAGDAVVGQSERQMRAEVEILRSVDHPNVMCIVDVYHAPKHLDIVMEFASHGDLFDYIAKKKKPAGPDISRFVMLQMLRAVDYLHKKDILHRDLKPENVLVMDMPAPGPIVKVTDFGLARFKNEATLRTLCGTPAYQAPEIVNNIVPYTTAVDVWSLGVFAYCLVVGYPPFSDGILWHKPALNMKQQITGARVLYPRDHGWTADTDQLKDLISQIFVVDAAKRLTATAALRHPFFTQHPETATALDTILEGGGTVQSAVDHKSDPFPPPRAGHKRRADAQGK